MTYCKKQHNIKTNTVHGTQQQSFCNFNTFGIIQDRRHSQMDRPSRYLKSLTSRSKNKTKHNPTKPLFRKYQVFWLYLKNNHDNIAFHTWLLLCALICPQGLPFRNASPFLGTTKGKEYHDFSPVQKRKQNMR